MILLILLVVLIVLFACYTEHADGKASQPQKNKKIKRRPTADEEFEEAVFTDASDLDI